MFTRHTVRHTRRERGSLYRYFIRVANTSFVIGLARCSTLAWAISALFKPRMYMPTRGSKVGLGSRFNLENQGCNLENQGGNFYKTI